MNTFYRDFVNTDLISLETLKQLNQNSYKNPVISVYINLDSQKVRNKNYLSVFNSLLKAEELRQKDFINNLDKKAKLTLKQDLEEIKDFLQNKFVVQGVKTLAIFKSGKELKLALSLPVRLYHPDRVVIDNDMYILPLISLFNKHKKTLVVKVTKEETILYRYHLGLFEKIQRIKHSKIHLTDKTGTDKVQKRKLTILQRYFKEIIKDIVNLHINEHFNTVILAGTKHTLDVFYAMIPDHLSKRIIGKILIKPEITEGTLKQEVSKAFAQYMENKEQETFEHLQTLYNKGELLYGKKAIINASNNYLIKKLYVSSTAIWPGYVCNKHHYLSLEPAKCPYCNMELTKAENLIDELVEVASLYHIDLFTFDLKPELLDKFDGAVAVTY